VDSLVYGDGGVSHGDPVVMVIGGVTRASGSTISAACCAATAMTGIEWPGTWFSFSLAWGGRSSSVGM